MIIEHHRAGVSWHKTIAHLFGRATLGTAAAQLRTRAQGTVGDYYGGYGWFGGQKWPGGLSSSGRGMMLDHKTLRLNARTAVHETPQARAIVGRFVDTVVDTGIILNPEPVASVLGITPERARDWSDEVGQRFHLWASSKKVSRSESETWYQLQRHACLFQQRDNDYFVRLFYSNRRDLQNPLQIQFIDPDQIGEGYGYTSTYGVQVTDDGIVRDAQGRETAYKIRLQNPDGSYRYVQVPAMGARSGRRFMLHGYQAEYPGQGRGFPRFAHAIQEFENLTDFTSAQIKKAINQSNITWYVKPSPDNVASNPMENLVNTYAGPATAAYGAEPTEAPQSALPLSELANYIPLPEATDRVPGSVGLFNLQQGEDAKPFESTAPSDDYDKFVDAFTAHLAASAGMPIEVLLMRFNQNYSASRATLVLFWRIAQIWRAELDADFHNPVYEMWLAGEIAARRIQAPGWSDPRLRAAWLNAKWEGAPMPEIDPFRQSRANKNYAELGAADLDAIARSVNGSDGRMNRAKLAKQYEELPPAPWAKKEGE